MVWHCKLGQVVVSLTDKFYGRLSQRSIYWLLLVPSVELLRQLNTFFEGAWFLSPVFIRNESINRMFPPFSETVLSPL